MNIDTSFVGTGAITEIIIYKFAPTWKAELWPIGLSKFSKHIKLKKKIAEKLINCPMSELEGNFWQIEHLTLLKFYQGYRGVICCGYYIVRQDNSLAKMIMEGMVEGKRGRGRPEKQWIDNIKEWTRLEIGEIMKKARDREQWRLIVRKASICPYGRETMG